LEGLAASPGLKIGQLLRRATVEGYVEIVAQKNVVVGRRGRNDVGIGVAYGLFDFVQCLRRVVEMLCD